MYAEKDCTDRFSIMDITPEDMKDIGSILLEFEYLLNNGSLLSDRERGRLAMLSAKLRFIIIDVFKNE